MKKIGFIMQDPFTPGGCYNAVKSISKNLHQLHGYSVTFICYHPRETDEQIKDVELCYLEDVGIKDIPLVARRIRKIFIRRNLLKRSKLIQRIMLLPFLYYFNPERKIVKQLDAFIKNKEFDILVSVTTRFVKPLAVLDLPEDTIKLSWIHNTFEGTFDSKIGFHPEDYVSFKRYHKKMNVNVLVSKDAKNTFEGKFKGRMFQIYNGISLNDICINVGKKSQRKKFGLVCRLEEQSKQVSHAINIFKRLEKEGYELVIYGQAKPHIIKEYESLIKDTSNIKLIIDVTDKNLIYNSFDTLLLTSRHEVFGLVLVEAMSYGLPVVAYNIPGVNEVVKHEDNAILVEPNNIDKMIDAIRTISTNEELYTRLSINGKQMVKNFNITDAANAWNILFEKLIEEKK